MNTIKRQTPLMVEFVWLKVDAKLHGAGFVDYVWQKTGSSKPLPKLSYVTELLALGLDHR